MQHIGALAQCYRLHGGTMFPSFHTFIFTVRRCFSSLAFFLVKSTKRKMEKYTLQIYRHDEIYISTRNVSRAKSYLSLFISTSTYWKCTGCAIINWVFVPSDSPSLVHFSAIFYRMWSRSSQIYFFLWKYAFYNRVHHHLPNIYYEKKNSRFCLLFPYTV